VDKLLTHRGALCGRLPRHGHAVLRTLSHHGLRPARAWRESLRDIEASLGANPTKLLWDGTSPSGASLNAGRCQRAAQLARLERLGPVLIRRARKLYAQEDLGLDVNIAATSKRWSAAPSICA